MLIPKKNREKKLLGRTRDEEKSSPFSYLKKLFPFFFMNLNLLNFEKHLLLTLARYESAE